MTHSLHRRGRPEDLARDYVVTALPAKGINDAGTGEQMRLFYEIVLRHKPVFLGDGGKGNQLTLGLREMVEGVADRTTGHAVFRDAETVAAVIEELVDAGFDRSVVISGLFEKVEECCCRAGIGTPHTLEWSLGTWGRTEKLSSEEDLEITSMCGHALVPASLVHHMVRQIQAGRLTPEAASLKLGHQCPCGIFNVARAAELLSAMASGGRAG